MANSVLTPSNDDRAWRTGEGLTALQLQSPQGVGNSHNPNMSGEHRTGNRSKWWIFKFWQNLEPSHRISENSFDMQNSGHTVILPALSWCCSFSSSSFASFASLASLGFDHQIRPCGPLCIPAMNWRTSLVPRTRPRSSLWHDQDLPNSNMETFWSRHGHIRNCSVKHVSRRKYQQKRAKTTNGRLSRYWVMLDTPEVLWFQPRHSPIWSAQTQSCGKVLTLLAIVPICSNSCLPSEWEGTALNCLTTHWRTCLFIRFSFAKIPLRKVPVSAARQRCNATGILAGSNADATLRC